MTPPCEISSFGFPPADYVKFCKTFCPINPKTKIYAILEFQSQIRLQRLFVVLIGMSFLVLAGFSPKTQTLHFF